MKITELDGYVFRCEAPGCHVALRLLVRINDEMLCPKCEREHDRRTRQAA